jgi:hypothetical protein
LHHLVDGAVAAMQEEFAEPVREIIDDGSSMRGAISNTSS